jgi:hypothetical protein
MSTMNLSRPHPSDLWIEISVKNRSVFMKTDKYRFIENSSIKFKFFKNIK